MRAVPRRILNQGSVSTTQPIDANSTMVLKLLIGQGGGGGGLTRMARVEANAAGFTLVINGAQRDKPSGPPFHICRAD